MNRNQAPDRDHPGGSLQPADIQQQGGGKPADRIQRGEDQRQHKAALQVDLVGWCGWHHRIPSKIEPSWRKFLATLIPLTVSLMAALTLPIARMPAAGDLAGQLRKPERHKKDHRHDRQQPEHQLGLGCHQMPQPRSAACTSWVTRSVTRMTTWPNSRVSEVIRETIRPEENSS